MSDKILEDENLIEYVSNLIATVGIYIEEKERLNNPFVTVLGESQKEKNTYLNMKSAYEDLSKVLDE